MRKFVFIILVILFSSIYYYSTVENENSLSFQIKKEVGTLSQAIKSNSQKKDSTAEMPQKEPVTKLETDFGGDLGIFTQSQLNEWIKKESAGMDMTNNDTAQIDIKLKASAKTLKQEQLTYLREKALDLNSVANERIFSAYMLTLNTSEASTGVQYDLANEPLPNLGPPTPHSESELKRAQELALRYMEVDELAEKAKTDNEARTKLRTLATSAGSEEVQRYVSRKIKELAL
jgi:hypothetical protein